jgi:uncharacterized protein (TIGR00661 family)
LDPKKNILICPLDWGLGHATRCVPIIKELLHLGHHVVIGADKNPLHFLAKEFPTLPTVKLPGYEVTYDEQGSSFKLFCESIRFYNFIKKEHTLLAPILKQHNIDVIISDNRYGLWNNNVKSIIISHQLYLKTPIGESLAHKKITSLIKNFDECWIPDVQDEPNLSGDLSHLKPFNHPHRFIGPLSRFGKSTQTEIAYDVCAVVSGPEPQRALFEEMVLAELKKSGLKCVLVKGLFDTDERSMDGNIMVYNNLQSDQLKEIIEKSAVVICRSGYSSIMDMVSMGKRAILVPTPGQTEQEYLARYHLDNRNFFSMEQKNFDFGKALQEIENYAPTDFKNLPLNLEFL